MEDHISYTSTEELAVVLYQPPTHRSKQPTKTAALRSLSKARGARISTGESAPATVYFHYLGPIQPA